MPLSIKLEFVKIDLNLIKALGFLKITWTTYWHDDETHTHEFDYKLSKDSIIHLTQTSELDRYKRWDYVVENWVIEQGDKLFQYETGRFELNVETGVIRRLADVYIPEPEMTIVELKEPEVKKLEI